MLLLLSEVILSDMKRSIGLPIGHSYPPFVVMQYDASSIDSRLSGLLLFPKAIFRTNDVTILQMCKLCHLSLGQKKDLPPPLSIANGNVVGWLPQQYGSLSRTEEQCCSLVTHSVRMATMVGGDYQIIKSHCYFVNNTSGPILSMLPADLAGRVRMTMVGAMTSQQKSLCKRRYAVNIVKTRDVLEFLIQHHQAYIERGIVLGNMNSFSEDGIVIDRTIGSDNPASDQALGRLKDADLSHNSQGSNPIDNTRPSAIIDRQTFIQ